MPVVLKLALFAILISTAICIWLWNACESDDILKISQSAEVIYSDKFQDWISRCEKLYMLSGIDLPLRVEASIKIGNKSYNTHRYSIYLPKILLSSVDKSLDFMKVPKNYREKIGDDIKERNQEIIYGVDLSNDCHRIYLNRSSEEVLAWEWNEDDMSKIAQKKYLVVTPDIATDMLKMFPETIQDKFYKVIPKNQWEYCCVKYDTRERTDIPCSLYISPMYAPSVDQIRSKLSSLISEIYDHDLKLWFDTYKNCSVSWYVLTKKDNKIELSVYLNTSGRLADFIERKMYLIHNTI